MFACFKKRNCWISRMKNKKKEKKRFQIKILRDNFVFDVFYIQEDCIVIPCLNCLSQ